MQQEHDIMQPNNYRIDEAKYRSLLKYIRLSVTEKYEFPQEIVQIDGVTIATIGNFSASTGKPKSKKTFNVSAIVASALSGKEVLKYKAELPPCKNRILYIDTEQSKCHCHKVLHRILKLADLPTDQENDKIQFLVLREYTPDQRRDIIRWALHEEQNIGLVIIDGIRDLIHDINSPSESLDIINELMRWSSYYELHIHTVLHLNKGDDNTRGHIGTELNNKAETILQISKNNENGKISEVRAMHIRDKEFTPLLNEALGFAKDETTRSIVKRHYEAKQKEYSQYKKAQRRIKRQRNGGIINFGIEFMDLAFNPSMYSDMDNDVDYVMYYNVGLGIRLGNYKSPVQFEIGAKPGLVVYTLWYGSEDETKTSFHLPLYARLKIGLWGGTSSKWYVDGIGYYNAVKKSFLESDYSVSAGLGVSWRHWDWRIIYYKQDIGAQHTYQNYNFLGTSFSYYF